MLRLAILDADGKTLAAKDVPTAGELLTLAEQARAVIRDCEQLVQQRKSPSGSAVAGKIPYLS